MEEQVTSEAERRIENDVLATGQLFEVAEWERLIKYIVLKVKSHFQFRYCRSQCNDDDIEQEAWLALTKAYLNFDPDRGVTIRTYAYKYTYFELVKYIQRQMKKRMPQLPDDSNASTSGALMISGSRSETASPEVLAEDKDTAEFALSVLSEDERKLVMAHVVEEESFRQMELGHELTYGGLSKRYRKSMSKMQQALARENH